MDNTFFVSSDIISSANKIKEEINRSFSGELVNDYNIQCENHCSVHVMVFEKYYSRVSNRLTLTVILDDVSGKTRVHYTSAGGGTGVLFRFDWGAADSFAESVRSALSDCIISD
ncbi:hypothetical protein SDC9_107799 [bioreactor metagenome]|uniref:Uncharacterized protein n=1 Tax=bioreactor metagenome TaxID=1076179 RepID=A0A645B689_9ZZZZ|nr:DUF6054 family protein [Oscillospiraceae bacterium]